MCLWKKMYVDSLLKPFIKVSSRWIIDLNVTCRTIELVEEILKKIFMIMGRLVFLKLYIESTNHKEKG